jgi:hypothetical protein
MGMTEQQQTIAREREEIATRVANFRATQQKFEREREEYLSARWKMPATRLKVRPSPNAKTKSPERCSGLSGYRSRNKTTETKFTSQVQQPRKR